ncbi:MAG: DUF2188 domain-containing protein [Betaproteobacteria bacterium]|nr:DUF2188 domain-containing protein [Betaproteobacteria bacterium]MBI2293070.1 DUF2188 domain-containing protein [Betaproteobacteria bacterium]MBI3053484.1 DUF2188 domain-containing protein [Betaproteobacteria bacterium]
MKRKYTLRFDASREKWILKHDVSEKVIKVFDNKEDATRAGVLRKALGREGGTVTLRTRTGVFDEERTFPRSADR